MRQKLPVDACDDSNAVSRMSRELPPLHQHPRSLACMAALLLWPPAGCGAHGGGKPPWPWKWDLPRGPKAPNQGAKEPLCTGAPTSLAPGQAMPLVQITRPMAGVCHLSWWDLSQPRGGGWAHPQAGAPKAATRSTFEGTKMATPQLFRHHSDW